MSEHIHREADIIQWGRDRNIYGGSTPQRQARKLAEEVVETVVAIAMGDRDETIDGIGDTIVCLVHQAEFLGLPIAECIEHSYQQIKDRGGEMRNGVFVKEADLATAPPDEGVEPDEAMSQEDAMWFVVDLLDDAAERLKRKITMMGEGE